VACQEKLPRGNQDSFEILEYFEVLSEQKGGQIPFDRNRRNEVRDGHSAMPGYGKDENHLVFKEMTWPKASTEFKPGRKGGKIDGSIRGDQESKDDPEIQGTPHGGAVEAGHYRRQPGSLGL
jgi:hypothetical protein